MNWRSLTAALRPRSLFVRLMIGYLVVGFVTLGGLGAAISLLLERYLFAQAQQEFVAQVRRMAPLWAQGRVTGVYLPPNGLLDPDARVVSVSPDYIAEGRAPDPLGTPLSLSRAEVDQVLGGDFIYRWLPHGSEPHILIVHPIAVRGTGERLILVFASPLRGFAATLRDTRRLVLIAAGFSLAVATGAAWLVSRGVARPLGELKKAAVAFAEGDYGARVRAEGDDEVSQVLRAFNYAADQLETTVEQQRRLELLRRDFMANVSHEFRAPLASLQGYLELMHDGVIRPEEQGHYLGLMQSDTARLNRLVGDLLDLARLQAGQVRLACRPVEPEPAVRAAADRLLPAAASVGVNLAVDLPETPLPAVLADPDRLDQVLLNLLSNALRFTPAGGTVTAWAAPSTAGLKFGVTDTGIGIPPEEQDQVWERFYKVDRARTPASEPALGGTGLGLAIVKQLVEAMGGQVGLTSEPEQGSTFWFSLPAAPST